MHLVHSDWWRKQFPREFSEWHFHNQLLLQHFRQIKMLNHKTKRCLASNADCNLDMLQRWNLPLYIDIQFNCWVAIDKITRPERTVGKSRSWKVLIRKPRNNEIEYSNWRFKLKLERPTEIEKSPLKFELCDFYFEKVGWVNSSLKEIIKRCPKLPVQLKL